MITMSFVSADPTVILIIKFAVAMMVQRMKAESVSLLKLKQVRNEFIKILRKFYKSS